MAGPVSRLFNRTLVKIAEPHINQTVAKREENWLAATQVDREAKDPYLIAARKAEEELCRKLPADTDVSENTLGNFCKIKFGYPSERSKQMKEREENWLAATQKDREAMEPFEEAARKAEKERCRKLPENAEVGQYTFGNFCKINYPS